MSNLKKNLLSRTEKKLGAITPCPHIKVGGQLLLPTLMSTSAWFEIISIIKTTQSL